MSNLSIQGFRLSPQQERLWLLQEKGQSFCSQCSLIIEGELNFTQLQSAVHQVIKQHEALRTTYKQLPGMDFPLQVIHDNITTEWNQVDLKGEEEKEQVDQLKRLYRKELRTPFDFENGPLFRLTVISLTEQKRVLLISISSLCADAVSLHNLVIEIQQAYVGILNFKDEEEPLQYIQFSEWKNEIFEEEESQLGVTFWENQNREYSMKLKLPWENQGVSSLPISKAINTTLSPLLISQLEEIAEKWELTLEELLFACWHLFMWRLTETSDVVVGQVLDGRKYKEMEKAVGLFAASVPVRYSYIPNTRLDEVLQGIAEARYRAYEWQEYFSYSQAKTEKGILYFSSGFEYNSSTIFANMGNLSTTMNQLTSAVDYFSLKMSCARLKDTLTLEMSYANSQWEQEYAQKMLESYVKLIQSTIEHPRLLITDIDILNESEKQKLLVNLNRNFASPCYSKCFHTLFEKQVEKNANNIAVVFEDQQLTYNELNERANQLAHYLSRQGAGRGVKIGICIERSLDMIVGLLGVLKTGGAYVPIDTSLPADRKEFILKDAGVSILLTQQNLLSTQPKVQGSVVCLDYNWDKFANESKENINSLVTTNDLAYIIYTSGSTGKPKGVAVEHGNLLNYLNGIEQCLNLDLVKSYATVSTLAADLGNTVIFTSLCRGGCLHVIAKERLLDSKKLADYCMKHTIDFLKIVPSHLSNLLSSSQAVHILPKHLLVFGGEVLQWDLVKRVKELSSNCKIVNHYGPTETTIGVTTYPIPEQLQDTIAATVPIGRPISNVQAYVLNSHKQLVPFGMPGELYIGGLSVTRGYLNRPEQTENYFIQNFLEDDKKSILYKTGDVVRYLPDGNLEFLGRIDDQVKIRGYRVELGEVQLSLERHPSIQKAIVVTRDDYEGQKQLIAYLVTKEEEVLSQVQLFEFLKGLLPAYCIPYAFVFLSKFPLTVNGKIDRIALPDPNEHLALSKRSMISPNTPTQEWVADIWYKVLGISKVSIFDKFFEIGGNSLKSVTMLVLLQERYSDITLVDLFEYNTIASISEFIDQNKKQEILEEDAIESFEL
ncbi:non-ribosomal peptide synthetase [Bacillus mycoides]|uniref:non-ribosomal peptide synthetase n=1 Tax=Bacillus mycoides TaxID=1405 RepID=UPI0018CD15C6|nr:non-ribosomal peptide synthetase [Bacillus mycoides]MBG9687408.1 hypothetical protein [Bacillus mycoides]QWI36294.1 amino acid adenylation domain-containing protein [Bacillus mycoides]